MGVRINKQNVWTVEFWKPLLKTAGYSMLGLLLLATLLGGSFFWLAELSGFIIAYQNDVDETEVAKAGLQTMQRMVGNNEAWSLAIEQEYRQLTGSKKIIPLADNYGTNFVTDSTR